MKTWSNFINENVKVSSEKYAKEEEFSLGYLSEYWSNLDQVLIDASKRIKDKRVVFHEVGKGVKKIKATQILYVRFVKPRGGLGNQWAFIDSKGKRRPITINYPITPYRVINEFDPYGEEEWND